MGNNEKLYMVWIGKYLFTKDSNIDSYIRKTANTFVGDTHTVTVLL